MNKVLTARNLLGGRPSEFKERRRSLGNLEASVFKRRLTVGEDVL